MKFTEFKNGLSNGDCFPVYLFEGEDAFFRLRGIKLIKEKFLTEPDLNFAEFEGASDLSGIESSLSSLPFMAEKRITLIREFYPDAKGIKGFLSEYLTNPPTDSILVIVNEKPCESIKKYDSVAVIDCKKEDASVIVRWIKGECGKYGVNIDGESAGKIAEYCLCDMARVENETQKLISYVGDGGTVSSLDVENMVYRDTEYKIYEMTDFIAKKNYDKAFSVITEMLGKNETPQRILSAVYNYFRKMLHIAISDKSDAELAGLIGIKEYAVKKTREQAKSFKIKSIKQATDILAESDYGIKSGEKDADEEMWLSVFKIITR